MHWMIPINALAPQQQRILDAISTNHERTHWIAGYAGTGKTIVITHAIERLVSRTRTSRICFLTYTHALKDLVHSGLSQRALDRVTIETIDTFGSTGSHYDYILVDEVQDITDTAIEKIFRRADHVVVAGDPDQSIYLGRVNPVDLKRLLGGALKHTLKHIQRLSLMTFQLATAILPEAEIVKGAEVKGEGNKGKVIKARSQRDEFLQVYTEAVRVSSIEQPSAILFPEHKQIYAFARTIAEAKGWGTPPEREKRGIITSYEAFNEFFAEHAAPIRFLGSNNGSLPESDETSIVYLMTYHSAKGLDFNNVFLPDLTATVKLDAKWQHLSKEENERRHLFVAITRSRENVYFSYHGEPHPLLAQLPEECLEDFVAPRTTFSR
ncbi:MAG: UvrD-helicase domain-containing protein [Novosphingobium sp.]|nr:UvrD-helicase domain-containing protein [Novosphingobium sp.]